MPQALAAMRHFTCVVAAFALAACQKADDGPPTKGVSRSEIEGSPKPKAAAKPQRPHQQPKPGTREPTAADYADVTKDIPGTGNIVATIETSMGTIHCDLRGDKAPMTVANFIGLETGKLAWWDNASQQAVKKPFFDGLTFHRVIPQFMIQGGDPQATGAGGPGYEFADEFTDLKLDKAGTLAMANAGPATNGSQFFITEQPVERLNGKHTVFGYCKEIDVVKAIARVKTGANNKPEEPVTIKTITFSRSGS
jgi:peptidyl-prolyl cis-trans isomerase A (cyclophilin A)